MEPQENKFLRAIGRSLLHRLSDDAPDHYSKRLGELMETLRLDNLVLHDTTMSPHDDPPAGRVSNRSGRA
jgi:hypothetical protein